MVQLDMFPELLPEPKEPERTTDFLSGIATFFAAIDLIGERYNAEYREARKQLAYLARPAYELPASRSR